VARIAWQRRGNPPEDDSVNILAPFDETAFSQATLPLLARLAHLPETEITLITIAHAPAGTPRRRRGRRRPVTTAVAGDRVLPVIIPSLAREYAETGGQAMERVLAELDDYLSVLAGRIGQSATIHIEAHVSDHPADTIIACACEHRADVIVMATHSRRGLARALFGSTTENVVRSGVAPVLVVHPAEGAE
jgi:nucleotide-binding universal stress UspA family protein